MDASSARAREDRATTPPPHDHVVCPTITDQPAIATDDDDLAIIADYVSGSFRTSRPGSFLPSVEVRRVGGNARELRRALRRVEELLDE